MKFGEDDNSYSELDGKVRKIIKKFIRSKDKLVVIEYKGKRLQAMNEWRRMRFNPRLYFNCIFAEILKKLPPSNFKNACYRLMGYKIGKDVAICIDVHLDPFFPELITVEDGVLLGYKSIVNVHDYITREIKIGRVHIKEGAIIGGRASVACGVTVGKNAVVSVSSVVTRDVEDYSIVGGNPSKKIMTMNEGDVFRFKKIYVDENGTEHSY